MIVPLYISGLPVIGYCKGEVYLEKNIFHFALVTSVIAFEQDKHCFKKKIESLVRSSSMYLFC